MPWRAPATYLRLALVAVGYYLAAQVGLAFALSHSVASPVWPPTGLAIAAVVILGLRAVPGVAVGAILTEVMAGVPPQWAVFMAAGTCVEAAVGGIILRKAGGPAVFERLGGIPWHAAAAVLAPIPAALTGVVSLVGSGMVAPETFAQVGLTWYLGDVGGAVLLTPAILLGWRLVQSPPARFVPAKVAEACLAAIVLAITVWLVFVLGAPFAYLYVVPLVWMALRLGPTMVAVALVALDCAAILATRAGNGPFVGETANRSLLLLQGFVVGVNLLAFAVAALSWERLRATTHLEQRVVERTRQLQDVNDRLRHEAAVRAEAEAQVDQAQHAALMGTWRWDLSQPHAQWSPELFRIYGLDPSSHVPSYDDYLTRIHPDDVERVKVATAGVMNDRQPYSHDERVRRPDGSWRILHTWAQPVLGPDRKLVALVGACQDVTEQKQSEAALQESLERFRALSDASPIGIVHTTPTGSVDYANQAWCDITGVTDFRDDGMVRRSIHPQDLPRSAALWRDAISNGSQFVDELRWVHPDGAIRLTLCRAVPVRDHAGTITGYVSTVEDITDQRAAAERDRQVRSLQEQAEFKTNFLRTAAHELGTPLTPIVLQMRLLRRLIDAKGLHEELHAVDVLERNIQRLRVLVQDLLESARLQSGRLRLNLRTTDLPHLVHEVVETFQGPAIENGVSLDMEGPPQLSIVADPDRLAQVLYNLLSNAMKFSRRGNAVHVRLEALAEDQVRVIVQDSGSGFPPERTPLLFQPFSQIHDTMQTTRGGSGLGLYISRGIVEEHGGTITASSDGIGMGATFVIALPRVARIPDHAMGLLSEAAKQPHQPPAHLGPGAQRPRIDVDGAVALDTRGAGAPEPSPQARQARDA